MLALLRWLPAECAHTVALFLLSVWDGLSGLLPRQPAEPAGPYRPVLDRIAENPIGLAAGLDKNGQCIDRWFALGFGFVEVGTVTPGPQPGNPKPRLFRLPAHGALINRMGFNNQGVGQLVKRLQQRKTRGVVGVNIGKNKTTPLADAAEDYVACLRQVAPWADYITLNISSPNTPGLRALQGEAYLSDLLQRVMQARNAFLSTRDHRPLPIWVKIAPDLSEAELTALLDLLLVHQVDGVIATNTTIDRACVAGYPEADEAGGLSGEPLYARATAIQSQCLTYLQGRMPLIAVGGIDSPEKATRALEQGAVAVQVYSAFIYQGPRLIRRMRQAVSSMLGRDGGST
jgi:dihydroorotate dehydrogenase